MGVGVGVVVAGRLGGVGADGLLGNYQHHRLGLLDGVAHLGQVSRAGYAVPFVVPGAISFIFQGVGQLQGDGGIFFHVADEDRPRSLILGQTLGLDQGKGHVPVQGGVVSQVDLLLAAFAKKPPDLVPAVGEG